MIDLSYEQRKTLSTENIAMILDFAAQAASDNGLMHYFIFERAMYVFAAQILFPDKKDMIADAIGQGYDIRFAFDILVKEGMLQEMEKFFKPDVCILQEEGQRWFEEAKEYEHSARGLLDTVTSYSGDIVKNAAEQLQKAASGDVQVIEQFASKWGFDLPNIKKKENTGFEVVE